MPVTLDMNWWNKTKPKGLTAETVTEALKKYLVVKAEVKGKPTRENIAKLAGALKLLQTACAQTKARCDKSLHRDCIDALDDAEALAERLHNHTQFVQQKFIDELATFQRIRDKTAAALTIICTTKNFAQASVARLAIEKFVTYIEDGLAKGNVPSNEMKSGLQSLKDSHALLKQIEQASRLFDELGATAKRVGSLGGFITMGTAARDL